MTEQQFESKVEAMAGRLEERVEKAADGLDRAVNRGYRKHRKAFRIAQAVLSLWLLQGFWLFPGTAGVVLGWLGILGVLGMAVQWLVFRI